jgi:hypothetical protein
MKAEEKNEGEQEAEENGLTFFFFSFLFALSPSRGTRWHETNTRNVFVRKNLVSLRGFGVKKNILLTHKITITVLPRVTQPFCF